MLARSTTVDILYQSQTVSVKFLDKSTTVDILYQSQTSGVTVTPATYLQQQTFYISPRPGTTLKNITNLQQQTFYISPRHTLPNKLQQDIYNSRHFILVLDVQTPSYVFISTTVDILYQSQTGKLTKLKNLLYKSTKNSIKPFKLINICLKTIFFIH